MPPSSFLEDPHGATFSQLCVFFCVKNRCGNRCPKNWKKSPQGSARPPKCSQNRPQDGPRNHFFRSLSNFRKSTPLCSGIAVFHSPGDPQSTQKSRKSRSEDEVRQNTNILFRKSGKYKIVLLRGDQKDRKGSPKGAPRVPRRDPKTVKNRVGDRFGTPGSRRAPKSQQNKQNNPKTIKRIQKMNGKVHDNYSGHRVTTTTQTTNKYKQIQTKLKTVSNKHHQDISLGVRLEGEDTQTRNTSKGKQLQSHPP